MVEYADRQEYMFIQNKILNDSYKDEPTERGEEWKGPYIDG